MNIVGISGSLRSGSFNTKLLDAAAELMPAGATLAKASIRGVPLYDADVEKQDGIPPPVTALKEKVAACDGLLLVTPEYNGSIPGVFKNAIDWMSRPTGDIDRVFGARPVAIIGATPGRVGTALSQRSWLGVLRHLRMRPFFGPFIYVSGAGDLFDAAGKLTDAGTRERVGNFLVEFVDFVRAQKTG